MESLVAVVLYIGKDFIPCARMLQVVHVQNVYDHFVDEICLAISLGVESHGLSELGIQHRLET